MSISAVYSVLNADAGYSAASSGGVFSYNAPADVAKPYTILFADNSDPIQSQGNAANKEWKDIIVATFATHVAGAKTLAALARTLLDDYQGTANGVAIEYCKYEGVELEDYDRELKKGVVEQRFRLCYVL